MDGPLSGTADTVRMHYDRGRRIVGTISPNPDGGGALKHRAVRNTYTNGLLTKAEQGTVNSQSDSDWEAFSSLQEVQIDYDYLVTGEVAAVREKGATSGAGVLATFGHDDLGRRASLTRGNGSVTTYQYDPVSRLEEMVHDFAGATHDLTLGFAYNPAGRSRRTRARATPTPGPATTTSTAATRRTAATSIRPSPRLRQPTTRRATSHRRVPRPTLTRRRIC